MTPFLAACALLSLAALVVTVRALIAAPEGFEDERGFHAAGVAPIPAGGAELGSGRSFAESGV